MIILTFITALVGLIVIILLAIGFQLFWNFVLVELFTFLNPIEFWMVIVLFIVIQFIFFTFSKARPQCECPDNAEDAEKFIKIWKELTKDDSFKE